MIEERKESQFYSSEGNRKIIEEKKEVKILENLSPVDVFKEGGANDILKAIREKALDFEPDTSTDKGRKEIASRSHSVSKSKVFLEKSALALKSEWKKKTDSVNLELRTVKTTLDDLRDEIRKPLTDYENEQKRIIAEKAEAKREEERKEAEAQAEKQRLIDEENARIKAEQEEAQRKIDEDKAKVEEEKRLIRVEQDRLAQEAIRQKVRIVERTYLDFLNALIDMYKINTLVHRHPEFTEEEIEEGVISTERAAALEKVFVEEKEKNQSRLEEEKRLREERDEKIKQDAIAEEQARAKAEKEKQEAEDKIKADKLAEEKDNQRHIDSIELEIKDSLSDYFGEEDTCVAIFSLLRDGNIPHVKIVY